ncbi:MAG: RNA polymerase sigma factor [Candidatus Aminicenantales bacterium]
MKGLVSLPLESSAEILSMREERVYTDEDISTLVEKIKEGDREAFMTLVSLFQKNVFLLAYSFFQNREDALDVVQETFLRFYRKAHMYQKGRNFKNWLMQIAKNICIDHYRKNYGRKNAWESEQDIERINLARAHSHDFFSIDLREIVTRCLKKLTERQRIIFVMKQYNELKYTEIAQILGISLGTVKSLHFKAVQNMKVLMASYLGR